MRFLALAPIAIFTLLCLTLSARMLRLAGRSRALPECWLGLGLFLMSAIGLPFAAVGRLPATVGSDVGHVAFGIGVHASAMGIGCLYAFTQSVFHSGSKVARAVAATMAAGALCIAAGSTWASAGGSNLEEILASSRPWAGALVAALAAAFVWSGGESALYYRVQKRRLSLGLADPVVVNRFLLWAVSGGTMALLCGVLMAKIRSGRAVVVDPISLAAIAIIGAVMCAVWTLTFFAPQRYLRWVRQRSASGA